MKKVILLVALLYGEITFTQSKLPELVGRLSGTWTQPKKNKVIYETWNSEDTVLIGSSVSFENGKKTFEENLRIHQRSGEVYYSSYVGENKKWIDFKLTKMDPDEARFENSEHDFPKYIHYTWFGKDSLAAVVGDDTRALKFYYIRSKLVPCQQPEYRQLDFWLGEWQAFNSNNQKAGDSRITKILDGCIVMEEWQSVVQSTSRKYSGKSFNTYDHQEKKWQQTWVDNHSESIEFFNGIFKDNTMTFYSKEFQYNKDTLTQRRLSFTKISENEVRQLGELVMNKEQVIKTEYDFIYKRKSPTTAATFESLLDSMARMYNVGDFIGIGHMYGDEAEIMGGNTFVKGRMQVDNYWTQLGNAYAGSWNLESLWVKPDVKNNKATQRGISILTSKDGKKSKVEFVLNWVNTLEGWKIHQDIYW